ncbi:MAG TPA: hypothetical protein VJ718_02970, partial [Candidatus Binataceae bacterium]|nr:hypothetical protein [Candidatus Binataceae bacterium]
PIRLGAVVGAAALSGGVVTISQITASGDDAAVSARGTIRLGPEIDDCVIDFTISLTPTAAGGRRFKPLLAMLPHPPAHGPYYVSGTLASPSLN